MTDATPPEREDAPDPVEAAKRDILSRVARGQLSPDAASEELARLESEGVTDSGRGEPATAPPGGPPGGDAGAGAPAGPGAPGETGASASDGQSRSAAATATAPPEERLRCVRVLGTFRTLRVVGDPDVREAVAEGPHRVRREGDALLIESEPADVFPGSYAFRDWRGFGDWRHNRAWSEFGGLATLPVTVRMHPDLALDVDLHAGSLAVRGVRAPIRAHVAAGTVRIEGAASPLDISVAAGTVAVSGVLDRGESKIECDAGKVRVALERGSSVRIKSRADVGRVDIPMAAGAGATEWLLGGGHEATIGGGEGELSVRVGMGAVQVFAEP